MSRVIVYSMQTCLFCVAAKKLLTSRNVPYQEIIVSDSDEEQWEVLFRKSGMKTVPQIFNGDRLIGGFSELVKLDQTDELSSLK